MSPFRILFYSGSIGLGHVTRDVAIAEAIRQLCPDARIDWLACPPARDHLLQAGEYVHPDATRLAGATAIARTYMRQGGFNITLWALAVRKTWAADGRMVRAAMNDGAYDAFIGDEAYDVAMALTGGAQRPLCPCFVLYDFLGLDVMSLHPLEWIGVEAINRAWARDPYGYYEAVFMGDLEDVPRGRFGLFGPRRRDWAARSAAVVGHVLPSDFAALPERRELRGRLGYGDEPLVLVSVGGTAAGSGLLQRCLDAFPFAQQAIPSLRMVLVAGPELQVRAHLLPAGVEFRGYVPKLYEHFAVCDLAIVQGGGTTTLELTALGRPFFFFPLLGHCEQQRHVAARQKRLGAGLRLDLKRTSAEALSRHIVSSIGREVNYASISIDGAQKIARMVVDTLNKASTTLQGES